VEDTIPVLTKGGSAATAVSLLSGGHARPVVTPQHTSMYSIVAQIRHAGLPRQILFSLVLEVYISLSAKRRDCLAIGSIIVSQLLGSIGQQISLYLSPHDGCCEKDGKWPTVSCVVWTLMLTMAEIVRLPKFGANGSLPRNGTTSKSSGGATNNG